MSPGQDSAASTSKGERPVEAVDDGLSEQERDLRPQEENLVPQMKFRTGVREFAKSRVVLGHAFDRMALQEVRAVDGIDLFAAEGLRAASNRDRTQASDVIRSAMSLGFTAWDGLSS